MFRHQRTPQGEYDTLILRFFQRDLAWQRFFFPRNFPAVSFWGRPRNARRMHAGSTAPLRAYIPAFQVSSVRGIYDKQD